MVVPRQIEPEFDAEYFAASQKGEPHYLLEKLEPHLTGPGLALDLGFGAGNTILWLVERGWKVVGIDRSSLAIETVLPRIPAGADVRLVEADMESVDFPDVDLAVAMFCLFMVPRNRFPKLWKRLKDSLPKGGLVAVSLLGIRDEWNDGMRTVHSSRAARALFRQFDVLHWEEQEREGKTIVEKAKYWHIFHVVAKKR